MDQITHIQSSLPGVRLIDAEYRRFAFPGTSTWSTTLAC